MSANGACPGMTKAWGIYKCLKTVDSAIKSRNDIHKKSIFYEFIHIDRLVKSPENVIPAPVSSTGQASIAGMT